MLTAEQQAEILHRHFTLKQKVRAIARALGVNRKSVDRVIKRKTVALGMDVSQRPSVLDPYKNQITNILTKDVTVPAQVILQKIRDLGFDGGYTIVRVWVQGEKERLLGTKGREAFLKIDFVCGQVAQVDWGEFNDLFGDGVKIHCFVMVLCFSRRIYVEFTRSEKFEQFIRCHENAFRFFKNKRPVEIWYDNLPTAVSERMGPLVRFNARFMAYAGHHHFMPHACNKARGNEKGRVENGVKYVRSNFIPGRTFADFNDLCRQAIEWRDGTANMREHQATRKVPNLLFEAEEEAALQPINPVPYEVDEIFSKEVRPDYHILYETNEYSVPWTLVGIVVTVRVSDEALSVYYHDRFIVRHERSYQKFGKFTKPEHEKGLIEIKPQGKNAHLTWQVALIKGYGPASAKYLECLKHNNRSLKSEIARLTALATVYGEAKLEEAIAAILKVGAIGSERIEQWLKNATRNSPESLKAAPMKLDERLSRIPARTDLRQYDDLLFGAKELQPTEEQDEGRIPTGDGEQKPALPESQALEQGTDNGVGKTHAQ